jgi:hypothetical protein
VATRLKAAAEASVALGLTAGAGFLGMRLFLGSPLNPQDSTPVIGPVPVPPAIAAIADDYEADLRYALHCIRERWSYHELRSAEWGRELSVADWLERDVDRTADMIPCSFGDEKDDSEEQAFRRSLRYIVGQLRDGHAGALFSEFRQESDRRWPFSLVLVEEGLMVVGVAEDTPWIQRGDLLLSVNGEPIPLPTSEDFTGASSLAAARWIAIREWARNTALSKAVFEFERPDDAYDFITLEAVPVWKSVPKDFDETPSRHHVMLEGDIGYFRPGDFSPPPDSGWSSAPLEDRDGILAEVYADFDRRLGELSEARALVLDLRGNPGGTDLLGQFLVDRLIDGDYVYFQLSSLRKSGWSEFHKLGSSAPTGETELHVPLAVLIDERSFSTADNVVACLADVHPDVIFVGQPNGAGSGAPRGFELPRTGATITFCTQRVADPKGDLIEGHPQVPDIRVRPNRAQWLAGEDPALDAACGALLEKL